MKPQQQNEVMVIQLKKGRRLKSVNRSNEAIRLKLNQHHHQQQELLVRAIKTLTYIIMMKQH